MVRRVRSPFELEVFDQSTSGLRRLEDFLAVYVRHLSPKHRTDTSQLLHYLHNPLPGRRIIYFGLTFRGEPCGFAALMHYAAQNIGIFDFIVIAPTARGLGAYFAFAELITEYLESRRIFADYFVAEVVADDEVSDPITNPCAIMRLLRHQAFKRARILYHAPDPSIVNGLASCRSNLMIASNQQRSSIPASELNRIVDLLYFDHYLLWYRPLMVEEAFQAYETALRDERQRFAKRAASYDPVILNGMKDAALPLDVAPERQSAFVTIFLTASAAAGLVAAVLPGVVAGSVVVGIATLVLGVAIWNRRLRRAVLKIFGQ
jgi:hypothetical protein